MLIEVLREGTNAPAAIVNLELEAAPLRLEVLGQEGSVGQRRSAILLGHVQNEHVDRAVVAAHAQLCRRLVKVDAENQ